jgi:histidinol phosphatase-like enzyme
VELSRLLYERKDVVIDDHNLTKFERLHYLSVFRAFRKTFSDVPSYQIECHQLVTLVGDIRRNAEARMALGGSRLNKTELVKRCTGREDPAEDEGFNVIIEIPFERNDADTYVRKAIFFSLPSVVYSIRNHAVPVRPADVRVFPNVDKVFARYYDQGYLFIGVANLPLVGSKQVSEQVAQECILEVIKQLTPPIDGVFYSPHKTAEKHKSSLPNPYFAFQAREEHKISLSQSVMVGCTSTDRQFAENAGIGRFLARESFFKKKPETKPAEEIEARFGDDHY